MEKIEYRALIKFLHLKGNTSTQMKAELDAVYGDSAPSFATVKRSVVEFKRGRTSLADDERSGRPTTATTTDNIEKIHQMIMDNRRIKIREIAEAVGISKERVCHILTEELGMPKRIFPYVIHFRSYSVLDERVRRPKNRFYNCVVNGLKPAGEVLKTNDQPTKIIPPYCYDTGAGMFDPDSNCVTSYRNCKKVKISLGSDKDVNNTYLFILVKDKCRFKFNKLQRCSRFQRR
ncbi:hypothetical protein ALC57_12093 [Trachymyrmex cornetzi]|uniref:Mos1 transposase HTH domain-containing protein n=1 Tax=Trachymyrmex cornetzi TaxID=471704 RepID=A0A151J1H1_9HYME|nr:hypothetical protein ALC57_12093 [Trachymyrmex cornetzi]